ncbi:MAG: PQQ-binding-like beta-propeller repeat protein [Planctomycetes bacterium]|nr:PQQ-binding-like beta-propeller repeat protein [Planctomycetota bacterium]
MSFTSGMKFSVAGIIFLAGLVVRPVAAQTASDKPVAGPHDSLAKEMLSRAGISRGVASIPRCGDGQLAMAIARNSGMVVHAMDADSKNVDSLAKQADAEGLLARRLYVEAGPAEAMPYADNLVDLVVISGLADADLSGLSAKEIMRVLSPVRGTAIVGRPKPLSADGKCTKAALDAWVKGLALLDTKVWDDETGVWAMVRKPALAGSEGWTHRYHGAGNNPVSADANIKGPLLTQWLGLPLHDGWWGTAIVSDAGRIFTIWAIRALYASNRVCLTARSLYNGSVLWERVLNAELKLDRLNAKLNYNPARCCMVAAGPKLYLIDGDGVLTLDAETGAELGRIAGPKAGGQIKWIALADGVLAMLAGEPDEMKTALMVYPANSNGTLLAAYDLAAGRELWRRQEKSPIDERMIAVNAGKIFFHAAGAGAFCLELKTGKGVWTNSDPPLLDAVDKIKDNILKESILSQRGLIATNDGIVLGTYWTNKLVVLSPQTGSLLCELPPAGWSRAIRGYVMDGKWWCHLGPVDLTTGKSAGKGNLVVDGCGPSTAAPGLQIGGFGQIKETAGGKLLSRGEIKSPCDMGTVVSDGVIVTPPSMCRCNLENWGYRALASGQGAGLNKIPDASSRLVSVSKDPPGVLAAAAADWPTCRANVARTGSTSVSVLQAAPAVRWRWSPSKSVEFDTSVLDKQMGRTTTQTQFVPTPPIAAAGKVWLGDASGVVRCLDAASGKQLWSFAAAARLFAPPALADGRLFFGSGDGWIYCLDAASGRQLWRFRAAPLERRTMWFGHLVSTWPVVTGVAVHEGVAYAAAGYQSINGVYVYALDAASGQVRWENCDTGRFDGPTGGSGAVGTMTVAGGRLWLAGGTDWPVSFDLKTGKPEPSPAAKPVQNYRKSPLRGCEIAVFADRFILYGGRRLISGYDERKNPGHGVGFAFVGLKDTGAQKPEVFALPDSTLPPVWDSELIVVARGNNGLLTGWSVPKLTGFLDETIDKGGGIRVEPPQLASPLKLVTRPTSAPASAAAPLPMLCWGPINQEFSATALAANALLATQSTSAKDKNAPPAWQLVALNRGSGEQIWAVPLSCEPIFNGLCVDRDGQIIVALRDGSLACYGKNP